VTGCEPVRSVDDEDRAIGHCECGGKWSLSGESVDPVSGRWVDSLTVRCSACRSARTFTFDITDFFEPRPAVWARRHRDLPDLLRVSLVSAA
jgi:hypothetical protein